MSQEVEIEEVIERAFDAVVEAFEKCKNCSEESLVYLYEAQTELTQLFSSVVNSDDEFNSEEIESFLVDLFSDKLDSVSEIVNDSDFFRSPSGDHATECNLTFRNLFGFFAKIDQNYEVILATNPNTPVDIQLELASSTFAWEEDGTAEALARTTTSEEVLRAIASSPINSARYEVAANPNTPADILERLATDFDISDSIWYVDLPRKPWEPYIQFAVLNNPNTPKRVLESFVHQEYIYTSEDFERIHGFKLASDSDLAQMSSDFSNIARDLLPDR